MNIIHVLLTDQDLSFRTYFGSQILSPIPVQGLGVHWSLPQLPLTCRQSITGFDGFRPLQSKDSKDYSVLSEYERC